MTLKTLCEQLEAKIQDAYQSGTTLEQAERLASEFLYGQIQISKALRNADLDSRMKKSGLKAVRAAIYLDIIKASDGGKKPTVDQLNAMVDSDEIVSGEQKGYDEAEVEKAELERYYDIFNNAHIHYRAVAKGAFGG